MDIDEIVFDEYVICPLCKKKMKSLSAVHLIHKHGYSGMAEFKLEFNIPMGTPLVSRNTRAAMQEKGKLRSEWFRKNVLPLGVEFSKKHGDFVSEELRAHGGRVRKGKSWITPFISEMKQKGWLDLHDAAAELGIAYNYARKCASDGRLKTVTEKGIRFTTPEWVQDTRELLHENRKKYRKDLLK